MNIADGKVIIDTDLNTKSFTYQIEKLEKQLNDMISDYETMAQEANFNEQSHDAVELRANIEKLSNRIVGYKNQLRDVGDEADKSDSKVSKSFEKGIKNLKRFGLSLLGIRSMFSLVSKASSAWLAQDTELAQKMQSVWLGLGSLLAPVLQTISNLLLKGFGYLNVFVKALTGIDMIANANAKALKNQAAAQKELNNQTYDFDVIRKQQDTSSGFTGGGASLLEVPELDDRIVKKLENFAKVLKDNKELIEGVGIALGITFGAVAMHKILSNLGILLGSATAGTGLLFLQALLVALAGAVVISLYLKNYEKIKGELQDLNDTLKQNTNSADNYSNSLKETSEKLRDLYNEGKLSEKQMNSWKLLLENTTKNVYAQIEALEKDKTWWGNLTGSNKEITKTQQELAKSLLTTVDDYELLYKQGKLTKEEQIKYKDTLEKTIKVMDTLGQDTKNLKAQYENLTGKKYTIEINAKDNATSILDKIKKGIQGLLGATFSSGGGGTGSFGSGGGMGGRYAEGGIVTQPTRALIGEAGYPEAVVPMTESYLSTLASLIAQYGGSGSKTTNVYLNGRLIQRELSKTEKDIRFETNR